MDTLILNEHVQLKKEFNLKKTTVKTLLNELFKKKSHRFFNFYVETMFLNEHTQLAK